MIDFKKSDGAKADKRISAAETSFGNTYSRVGRFWSTGGRCGNCKNHGDRDPVLRRESRDDIRKTLKLIVVFKIYTYYISYVLSIYLSVPKDQYHHSLV